MDTAYEHAEQANSNNNFPAESIKRHHPGHATLASVLRGHHKIDSHFTSVFWKTEHQPGSLRSVCGLRCYHVSA
jgi:hypothetical protein